jgi:hypothetical protein
MTTKRARKTTRKTSGRPTKFTPDTLAAIERALQLGMTRRDACVHGGIDDSTFCEWMNEKPEFAELVQKAETHAKLSRVERITKAGQRGTWQADAWMLERKYPQEFAQRLVVQVTPEDAALLKKHGLTPGEAWQALMQQLVETTK